SVLVESRSLLRARFLQDAAVVLAEIFGWLVRRTLILRLPEADHLARHLVGRLRPFLLERGRKLRAQVGRRLTGGRRSTGRAALRVLHLVARSRDQADGRVSHLRR